MRTVSQVHDLFSSVNNFVCVAQCSPTSSSLNTHWEGTQGDTGRAAPSQHPPLITNKKPSCSQHWHLNHHQFGTEWKTTLEFGLMRFTMLCNCPVTTQRSHRWIKFHSFLCSERSRKHPKQPCRDKPIRAGSHHGGDGTLQTSAYGTCKMINGAENEPEHSLKDKFSCS